MRTDLAQELTEHDYIGGGCDHSSALYADCDECIASGDPEQCIACRYSYCEYCFAPVHTHKGESLFPDLVDHNYNDNEDN